MSINKRREEKKKQREKEVKVKLEKRREATKAASRAQLLAFREQRKFRKEQKEFEKFEKNVDEFYNKLPQKTKEQLEKNIEILKALEEEHEKNLASKQKLNEELESEGKITPKEKMEALHEKVVEKQKKECAVIDIVKAPPEKKIGSIGGSADYSFKPNS